MERDPRAYLWEVQQAAKAILEFTKGLDFAAYAQSNLIQSAVERKFEIIGEALNQLAKTDRDLAGRIPETSEAVSFPQSTDPRLSQHRTRQGLAHRRGRAAQAPFRRDRDSG